MSRLHKTQTPFSSSNNCRRIELPESLAASSWWHFHEHVPDGNKSMSVLPHWTQQLLAGAEDEEEEVEDDVDDDDDDDDEAELFLL